MYNSFVVVMNKFSSFLVIVSICFSSAFLLKQRDINVSKAWVGLAYVAAKRKNISAEQGAVIGIIGSCHSAMHGLIWGAAFGGPAGAVAGLTVSL